MNVVMKTGVLLLRALTFSAVIGPLAALAQTAPLIRTIPNPAPASLDSFGYAVAAMGPDRMVIGAPYDDAGATDAGRAYLFDTNGALLVTLTNPAPAASDYFGRAVAAGKDWLAVGAFMDDPGTQDAGSAYMFHTNGSLIQAIANPFPEGSGNFGYAVVAAGNDGLLAGARCNSWMVANSGVAYLFLTNETPRQFTSPAPGVADYFGCSVAALGTNRLLVGAQAYDWGALDSGIAYLFSTDGTLLTTFTNPTPATSDYFGFSLAAVGEDRVLIGAYSDNTGANDAGAAYLFDTNGALLLTLTNPTPAATDNFGYSVAAAGPDRVLIGAPQDDTGALNAGAAYLFSTDGTLLTTLTNPTPATGDNFGWSVAASSDGWMAIGVPGDGAGAFGAGVVCIYAQPPPSPPRLAVRFTTTNTVAVSWPASVSGWLLHATTNLVTTGSTWTEIPPPYQTNGAYLQFVEPTPKGRKFYRLHKP